MRNEFRYAFNCHCSKCRRSTGAAFKPIAGIERSKILLERASKSIMIYGDPDAAHDIHCGNCGSLLFSVVREGSFVHLAMGTLVDAPNIKPSMHIFVASKAPWYEIKDDLPQHEAFPDE